MRALLPMQAALDLVEEALRLGATGRAENQPRRRIRYDGGLFHYMAAAIPGQRAVGLKAYDSTRQGTRFVVVLFDAKTSELLALLEADWLGRIRTGAASGAATRALARPDSRVAGVIGAGGQAVTQIEALVVARHLELVKVFSRTPEARQRLAGQMSEKLGLRVEPVASACEAVEGSDIVTTITSSAQPVVEGEWLAPGVHINAAGSNGRERRELDEAAVQRSRLVVADSREQARMEAGDLLQSPDFDWSRVVELGEVISGKVPGRNADTDITLFESQGVALEDVAVARYVYDRAIELERGERVAFGGSSAP